MRIPRKNFAGRLQFLFLLNCFFSYVVSITKLHVSGQFKLFASDRSTENANLCLFVCSSVCLSNEKCSRAHNLHLTLSGQSQVSLRSWRSLLHYFIVQLEPKILRLVQFCLTNTWNILQCKRPTKTQNKEPIKHRKYPKLRAKLTVFQVQVQVFPFRKNL